MTEPLPTPRTWQDDAAAEVADAARQLSRGSVLVVGDAMLDRYFYGEANRISQEAPVPVLSLQRELSLPGGAANVVRNITAVGAAAAFVAVVGDDMAGSDLTALIGRQSGVEPWLLVQGSRVTTVKTRFLAQGQHLLRADTEDPGPLHVKIAERLLRIATDAMTATSVTLLSDYNKGVLAGDMPARLIQAARQAGRPIIVDPRGVDYAGYAGADVIMPNRRELASVTGLPAETDEEIEVAARAMLSRHQIGAALVTRSEHGTSLVTPAEAWHFPAEALDVHDVSGAGDTVAAVLAAGMAARLPLRVAARLFTLRVSRGVQSADRQQQNGAQADVECRRSQRPRGLAHDNGEQEDEPQPDTAPSADAGCAGEHRNQKQQGNEESVNPQFDTERSTEGKAPGTHGFRASSGRRSAALSDCRGSVGESADSSR